MGRRLQHVYWSRRVVLALAVDDAKLRGRMPLSWRPTVDRRGANLLIELHHVDVDLRPDGRPHARTPYLFAGASGPAERDASRPGALIPYLTLTERPEAFEGWEPQRALAWHEERRSVESGAPRVRERYEFWNDRDRLEVEVVYGLGETQRLRNETRLRCPGPVDRLYARSSEDVELPLRGEGVRGDLVRDVTYRVEGTLADLVDGEERLVSLLAVPGSMSEVYALDA